MEEVEPKLRIQMDMQYPTFKTSIYEFVDLKEVTLDKLKEVLLRCKNELEYHERREKRRRESEDY